MRDGGQRLAAHASDAGADGGAPSGGREAVAPGRLSQADFARQLGVSRASVCRWAATLAQEGLRGLEARSIPGQLPRL
jgi:hypothetical protein